jgi:predicted transcriptional regulator
VTTEDPFISPAAARLSAAAPHAWDEFKAAFQKYTADQANRLVRAPREDLERAQGRAQQCTVLHALFDDAVAAARRIEERAKQPRSRP